MSALLKKGAIAGFPFYLSTGGEFIHQSHRVIAF